MTADGDRGVAVGLGAGAGGVIVVLGTGAADVVVGADTAGGRGGATHATMASATSASARIEIFRITTPHKLGSAGWVEPEGHSGRSSKS